MSTCNNLGCLGGGFEEKNLVTLWESQALLYFQFLALLIAFFRALLHILVSFGAIV